MSLILPVKFNIYQKKNQQSDVLAVTFCLTGSQKTKQNEATPTPTKNSVCGALRACVHASMCVCVCVLDE